MTGEVAGTIEVPEAFGTEYRPDMIKKAVLAAQANGRQPYGPGKMAGMRHSVSTWGKGRGVSRVQRVHDGKKATESPNNVSGRRAHPPVPERKWAIKLNKKELKMARMSAIAATANADIVKARGHMFDKEVSFPIVMNDDLQNATTVNAVSSAFKSIGIGDDLVRASEGKKIRAGRGTMRNRKYRTPVSVLIVVSERDAPVFKGAGNLPGVQIETVDTLSASILAPGGDVGRLVVYTASAVEQIRGWTE